MKKNLPLMFLALSIFCSPACKKPASPQNCNLNMVYDTVAGFVDSYKMTYNSRNQVSAFTGLQAGLPESESLKYTSNTLLVTFTQPPNSFLIDSVTFDDSGRVVSIDNILALDTTHLHFYYIATGELTTSTMQHSPGSPAFFSRYQYTNGDITTEIDSSQALPNFRETLYFSYYTDRPSTHWD